MSSIINTLLTQAGNSTISKVQYDELSFLVIKHPECEAILSLHGAHLIHWQPKHTSRPVFWLSNTSLFKKNKAIRGGVPICWPWFGNVKQPSHGIARISEWSLDHQQESKEHVELALSLSNEHLSAKIYFTLGKTCKIILTSAGEEEITSALHSYFNINSINNVKVTGLGEQYIERLTTQNPPKQLGEMTFNQEVDRIYTHSTDQQIIIDDESKIILNQVNHSDVVVWNPWETVAANMADLDGYQNFVCVETARINKPITPNSDQKQFGVEISVTQ